MDFEDSPILSCCLASGQGTTGVRAWQGGAGQADRRQALHNNATQQCNGNNKNNKGRLRVGAKVIRLEILFARILQEMNGKYER